MKEIKKIILLSVLLAVWIVAVSTLVQSFFVFQKAYHGLCRLMSHPSIEILYTNSENEEE